ncbi:hypothetical protein [Halovulum sp. GXIMD14793]
MKNAPTEHSEFTSLWLTLAVPIFIAIFVVLSGVSARLVDDTLITAHYANNLFTHGTLTWWHE